MQNSKRPRCASETAKQREERLNRRRIRDMYMQGLGVQPSQSVEQRQTFFHVRRERLNTKSGEERDDRLQQMRELTRERRATESSEQGEARLQQAREQMRDRVGAESEEQREARLQQITDCLGAESAEQREIRLQQMSRTANKGPPGCRVSGIGRG